MQIAITIPYEIEGDARKFQRVFNFNFDHNGSGILVLENYLIRNKEKRRRSWRTNTLYDRGVDTRVYDWYIPLSEVPFPDNIKELVLAEIAEKIEWQFN